MRGPDAMQESLFTVAKLDDFVPADHPLRAIRVLVNDALAAMNTRFNEIYADSGRDSIAPEKLIRALLLQVFYSIRSERQLCEQLRYNLLFRWFVGVALDDPIWDHSTFSKNRDRLLGHQVVEGLFAEVLRLADSRGLLSKEHFSVDGTLIQAWASQKSFRPKDGSDDQRPGGGGRNAQADWKGQPRTNDTHASTTDPDARTYRKSHNTASILCYQGHVLMENRNGLVVSAVVYSCRWFRGAPRGAWPCSMPCPTPVDAASAPTKPTTPPTSLPHVANARSRRTSPATTPAAAAARSTGVPPAIRVTA